MNIIFQTLKIIGKLSIGLLFLLTIPFIAAMSKSGADFKTQIKTYKKDLFHETH